MPVALDEEEARDVCGGRSARVALVSGFFRRRTIVPGRALVRSRLPRRSDVAIAVRAAVLLPSIRGAARRRPHKEVVEELLARSPVQARAAVTFEDARRVGQLVNGVANRLPGDFNCVPRTLTTWYLLRRRGIIVDMPMGVRVTEAGERRFHTWAELDGVPLNDRRTVVEQYRRFGTSVPIDGGWE